MLGPEFWKKYFKVYDTLNHAPVYEDLVEKLVEECAPVPGMYVFDAGAGTGNVSLALKKRGARVLSFDFSEAALIQYKTKDPSAETLIGDLTKPLPFESESFDAVVSNNVLYNLPRESRLATVKELYRVLKPGGKIVVSNVHNRYKPIVIYKESIRLSLKRRGFLQTIKFLLKLAVPTAKIFYYNFRIQHQHKLKTSNLFAMDEQEKLLQQAGFKFVSPNISVFSGQAILNTGIK